MAIMLVCGAVLVAALVAGVRWSGSPFRPPPADVALTPVETARRFAWYAAIVVVAGPVAGVTVMGAGGRLAMRLLAVTAGDAAQGRVTEADEFVGRITVGGTIGFAVFIGVFGGLAGVGLYLLLRRYFPSGRAGGAAFGLALLAVLGPVLDPIRRSNPDFDLVGPGWLAVVVFTLMAVAFGVVLAGLCARLSTWLPLPSRDRRVMLRYLLPLVLAGVAFTATAFLVVLGLVVVIVTRWTPLVAAVRSARAVVVGRVLVGAAVVAGLPNAVISVADIATR